MPNVVVSNNRVSNAAPSSIAELANGITSNPHTDAAPNCST
jgi:hypothetical protein